MQKRLASYLRDNQEEIIENWLTGAAVPEEAEPTLLQALTNMFEEVLRRLEQNHSVALVDADTASDLARAGFKAFEGVLTAEWDAEGEFTGDELRAAKALLWSYLNQVCHRRESARWQLG